MTWRYSSGVTIIRPTAHSADNGMGHTERCTRCWYWRGGASAGIGEGRGGAEREGGERAVRETIERGIVVPGCSGKSSIMHMHTAFFLALFFFCSPVRVLPQVHRAMPWRCLLAVSWPRMFFPSHVCGRARATPPDHNHFTPFCPHTTTGVGDIRQGCPGGR